MRILSQSWSNLSKGYQTARELEQLALGNWQARWEQSVTFAQQQGLKKAANFIQQQIVDEKKSLRMVLLLLGGLLLLLTVLSQLAVFFPNWKWLIAPVGFFNLLQALLLLLPVVDKLRRISQLARQQPQAESADVMLDVTEQWWQRVADGDIQADAGEQDFAGYLARNLPDEYIAVRSLLVKKSLDVDVLLVGPTGIWIFEVKDWRGRVTCQGGIWQREDAGDGASGPERPFDEQWLDERDNIEKTLNLRLARNARLGTLLRGGLVFTHPAVELDIDKSSKADYGTPEEWLQRIRAAAKIQQFSVEVQLLILDTLLDYALSLAVTRPMLNSAVDLAKLLYGDLLENLRQYILRQVRAQAGNLPF